MMEGDQVEAVLAPQQQIVADTTGDSQTVNIAGMHKVNFHTLFPRIPVDQDLCVPGT